MRCRLLEAELRRLREDATEDNRQKESLLMQVSGGCGGCGCGGVGGVGGVGGGGGDDDVLLLLQPMLIMMTNINFAMQIESVRNEVALRQGAVDAHKDELTMLESSKRWGG